MGRFWKFLTGLGVGAGVMYLLDPQQGRRRRSETWSRVKKTTRRSTSKAAALCRDAAHRTKGATLEATRRLRHDGDEVSDDTLRERVRAEMGHHVTNASALDVQVKNGRVRLEGVVREEEIENLKSAVASVPGVRNLNTVLEARARPN